VLERWLPYSCPVPIPLPFGKLEQIVQRFDGPLLEECFLAFSAKLIKNPPHKSIKLAQRDKIGQRIELPGNRISSFPTGSISQASELEVPFICGRRPEESGQTEQSREGRN